MVEAPDDEEADEVTARLVAVVEGVGNRFAIP
jgi:hypothetical protein